jgi:hypothetical protein
VDITLSGVNYRIPARPAADWIEAILQSDVVPGLLAPELADRILQDVVDGRLDADELTEATREAIEAAAGRPWWEAERLVRAAAEHADVMFGVLINSGFDFQSRSLGAFCCAVYERAVRNMEQKDRLKFDQELMQPPIDVISEDEDALSAAFMAAMNTKL